MWEKLAQTISTFKEPLWDEVRLIQIDRLVDYIVRDIQVGKKAKLNFICTHNSRRSQFAQIWGQTLAGYFDLPIECFSGGVEVTEFNPRAVRALKRDGFLIEREGEENPLYSIRTSIDSEPYFAFSKCYDDQSNPESEFAAIMTCDHADENCPFILGAEIRIPLRYEDPKLFDGTIQEEEKYSERSRQIGSELFFCFQLVKSHL
jgi:arsenate reductase (thioredoxin)